MLLRNLTGSIVMAIGFASSSLTAQPNEWPDEVRQALIEAAVYIRTEDAAAASLGAGIQERGEPARRFDVALDKIAAVATAEVWEWAATEEAKDISAKLAAIAHDRQAHPEVYEEIRQKFIRRSVLGPPRSRGARPLRLRQDGGKYRLVLEFYVLSPTIPELRDGYSFRALQALGGVKDDASLVTLLHCYGLACHPSLSRRSAESYQQTLLGVMCHFQSEQGFRTILKCLSMSAPQQRVLKAEMAKGKELSARSRDELTDEEKRLVFVYNTHRHDHKTYGDLETYVRGLLNSDFRDTAQQWQKVIERFPRDTLPADHFEISQRLTVPDN